MLIDLPEDERQVILMALAHLAVERPGWCDYLTRVSRRLCGEELFTAFRAYRTEGLALAHVPTPPGAPQQEDLPMPDRSSIVPPSRTHGGDPATRRAEAARRRAALVAHGCSTYARGRRGGWAAIQCLCCGLGSVHPGDIAEKFCGFCKAWHNEWRD